MTIMTNTSNLGLLVGETIESVEKAVLDDRGDGNNISDLFHITTKSGMSLYFSVYSGDREWSLAEVYVISGEKAKLLDEGKISEVFYPESRLEPGFMPVSSE